MALVITKKTRTILLIILAVLVLGGGGFILWRVLQEETVAPEDSEAAAALGFFENVWCDSTTDGRIAVSGWACDSTTGDSKKISVYVDGELVGTTTSDRERGDSTAIATYCKGSGDRGFYFRTTENYYGEHDVQVKVGTQILKDPTPPHELLLQSVTCPTLEQYTVTYSGNGGTCSPTSRTVDSGGTSAAPTCTRTGYTLTKFSKSSGTCGSLNTSTGAVTNVTCDLTIKATWTKKTYTVTYDANGGTCSPASRTVEYRDTAAAPSCSKSGYYVAGFKRTSGGGGTLNTATGVITNVSGNQTIQVLWSKSCGDGTCASDENANSCPVDCPAECGDGYCTHGENAFTCPDDCDAECGDGYCTHGENASTCPDDCDAECGDGYCTHDENAETCSEDCDEDCGDGVCTGGETPLTCPADCESVCGDDLCTEGEDEDNCPEDCETVISQNGEDEEEYGEDEEESGGESIPQTGIFDTILGRISLGVSFIFLGGLVSQYSRINYFFNGISEKRRFRRDVRRARRKEEKILRRRERLEKRFK